MGVKKVLAYLFLSFAIVFVVLFLLDNLIPNLSEVVGTWWLVIHNVNVAVINAFTFVFYYNLTSMFIWILIAVFISASIYAISYNMTKKHRLGGSLTCIFCAITWLILFELTIIWGVLGMVLNPEWSAEWKLILFIGDIPLLLLAIFVLNLTGDVFTFWIDILKENKEYPRLRYRVETNGRIKVIHIDMSQTKLNSVFSAACYILVEDVIRKEGDSNAVSRFIRSAITNIIFEIASHFNIWSRFKNVLFRFVGLKIGRDVLVSQYTRVDGLLPNLIILEDHTALGVACNLITHTFIDRGDVRAFLYGPIQICKYARIGANVTITPGILVGEGAVVAAGSLVNKDVPPYTMVGGVPAKLIKEIDPGTYQARIEKDISQIKKDTSQIKKDTSQIKKESSRIKKETSQIEKDTSRSSK